MSHTSPEFAPYMEPAESKRVSDEFFYLEHDELWKLKNLLGNLTKVLDYWDNPEGAPDHIKDDVSDVKKKYLDQKGWSQEEIAELAGKLTKKLHKREEATNRLTKRT